MRRAARGGGIMAAVALALCAGTPATVGAAVMRLPVAITGRVTKPHGINVLLTGTVNPEGSPTTYYFQFGPTTAYVSRTVTGTAGSGINPVKIGLSAAPMRPGYHYRLVAINLTGTSVGKDRVFSQPRRSKLRFEVPKGASTTWGKVVVISGRLLGVGSAGHRIALLESPYPY